MPHWLFPESLKDGSTYAQAQRYWEDIWTRVLLTTGQDGSWEYPWMQNPIPDGNPVFSAMSRPLRRGVRIIQEEPRDPDDVDLDWWLDYFGEKTAPEALRELVIATCPSRENAAALERLITQWVRDGKVILRTPNVEQRALVFQLSFPGPVCPLVA